MSYEVASTLGAGQQSQRLSSLSQVTEVDPTGVIRMRFFAPDGRVVAMHTSVSASPARGSAVAGRSEVTLCGWSPNETPQDSFAVYSEMAFSNLGDSLTPYIAFYLKKDVPGRLTTTFKYKGPGFKRTNKVKYDEWTAGGWWVTDIFVEQPPEAGRTRFRATVSGGVKGDCESAIRFE